MFRFLVKGILRDKNRSWLPIIVVAIGVALTVFLSGYLKGSIGDMVDLNAKFATGHVKIMTKAYAENEDQMPIDLALLGVDKLTEDLNNQFPDMEWISRIRFGGLIDIPGPDGETIKQGPAAGLAIDFAAKSGEVKRMSIESSLVSGKIPHKLGECLIAHDFAERLDLQIGDELTYFGSTMYGSMTFQNLKIAGTIRFGVAAMDRGMILIDIEDAQQILDMEDGAGEVLGFLKSGLYYDDAAAAVATKFNGQYLNNDDEFAPVMLRLKDQAGLGDLS